MHENHPRLAQKRQQLKSEIDLSKKMELIRHVCGKGELQEQLGAAWWQLLPPLCLCSTDSTPCLLTAGVQLRSVPVLTVPGGFVMLSERADTSSALIFCGSAALFYSPACVNELFSLMYLLS